MKKSLIALGVAAGMFGVAHADTTNLYGALGFSMSVENDGRNNRSLGDTFKDNTWDLATHTSRFGIKGTEDLSNGMQAFFKFELGVDAEGAWVIETDENGKIVKNERDHPKGANVTRYAHIGLKGDFGTITLGRQDTLWKTVMDKNFFNDVFASVGGLSRATKTVSYVSPSFGGFSFGGSAIIDGANNVSKSADAFEVAAMYKNYGVDAGVVYTNVKSRATPISPKDTTEYMGVNVGYEMQDTFKVNVGYAHVSSRDDNATLQGEYKLNANTFRAGVKYTDNKGRGAADPWTAALGYQYNFSKRTYVWVEGDYTDYDVPGRDDGYRVFVGARHNF